MESPSHVNKLWSILAQIRNYNTASDIKQSAIFSSLSEKSVSKSKLKISVSKDRSTEVFCALSCAEVTLKIVFTERYLSYRGCGRCELGRSVRGPHVHS